MSSSRASVAALVVLVLQSADVRAQEPAASVAAPTAAVAPAAPRHSRPLVWGGATLFVLSYMAAAIVATTSYPNEAAPVSPQPVLWVPAVGPFIGMAGTSSASIQVALALDGLAQVAGLTLFFYGLSAPAHAASASTLSIAPLLGRDGSGAAIVGTF